MFLWKFVLTQLAQFIIVLIIATRVCESKEWAHWEESSVGFKSQGKSNDGSVATQVCDCDSSIHEAIEAEVVKRKACHTYMVRFVNVILRGTGLSDSFFHKDVVKNVKMELRITGKDLETLKRFGEERNVELSDVDKVLSKIFLSSDQDEETQDNFDFSKSTPEMNPFHITAEFKIIAVTSCLAIFFIWLILSGKPTRKVLVLTVALIFFVSSAWNWIKLHKEEEARQRMILENIKNLPEECGPKSFWQSVFSMFQSTDRCEEYYKAEGVDSHIAVSPEKVFSKTFTDLAYLPLRSLGSVVQDNIKDLSSFLPFPFNWIFSSIITVLVLLIMAFLLALLAGGNMKLSWILGSFEIGRKTCSENRLPSSRETQTATSRPIQDNNTVPEHPHELVRQMSGSNPIIINWLNPGPFHNLFGTEKKGNIASSGFIKKKNHQVRKKTNKIGFKPKTTEASISNSNLKDTK